MASCSDDKTIKIWDVSRTEDNIEGKWELDNYQPLKVLESSGEVVAIYQLKRKEWLLDFTRDKKLELWDLKNYKVDRLKISAALGQLLLLNLIHISSSLEENKD